MEAPEYQVHFSMWEWGRFLDLILWSNNIIDLDELKDSLTASQLKESNAKAEQLGINPIEFDLAEWQDKVKVQQDVAKEKETGEKNTINVHASPDKTGRNIYHGISLMVSEEPSEKDMEKLVRTGAMSLSVFQDLEDKMFYNKNKLGHLYGIQGNDFDLSKKACWELYSAMTCFMTGDNCFLEDMSTHGIIKLGHKRMVKKKKSMMDEFLKDVAEEYLGVEFVAKMARLTGIIINSIVNDEQAIVR